MEIVARYSGAYDAIKQARRGAQAKLRLLDRALEENFTSIKCPHCFTSSMWENSKLKTCGSIECPDCKKTFKKKYDLFKLYKI